MRKNLNLKALTDKLLKNIGFLGLIGIGIIILVVLSCIGTSATIIFNTLIGANPVDDETGILITIPWLAFTEFLILGIILLFIDKGYQYLKSK
ncbi:hypothetical protein EZ449_21480 [Pedobacter frigidisoli]|uniref:Uncharacterized protein n=1 Tax=Pedobacter frigidisoli TaxID=2530455 RepID=A0A4R0NF55_9SPHI|nr:hypothetical protein [Pedobacter frigidisoli]TCC99100.1 hypothetical protein EZ449_21480 [Pedobacter frigidisoli]